MVLARRLFSLVAGVRGGLRACLESARKAAAATERELTQRVCGPIAPQAGSPRITIVRNAVRKTVEAGPIQSQVPDRGAARNNRLPSNRVRADRVAIRFQVADTLYTCPPLYVPLVNVLRAAVECCSVGTLDKCHVHHGSFELLSHATGPCSSWSFC